MVRFSRAILQIKLWQTAILLLVLPVWHLASQVDTQVAFFIGEPFIVLDRLVDWLFITRDVYIHLAITLLKKPLWLLFFGTIERNPLWFIFRIVSKNQFSLRPIYKGN
jgi:NitT/TauT family transport system permease protein